MSYSSAAQAKPRATAAPAAATPMAVASTAAPVAAPVAVSAARHEPLNSFNAEEVAQHLQNGKDLSLFQLILWAN